jgi:HupE/UreJ protein
MVRLPRLLLVVAACVWFAAIVRAHDISDQIVEIVVQPRGDRLVVRLHLPSTVLGYARLPRLDDGTLNVAALDGPLRIVAADVARNLDVQQGDRTLAAPAATATVGADRHSIDVDLTYAIQPGVTGFSARLNTFPPIEQPIRTNVRFQPSSAHEYPISVTGAATRILFDPDTGESVQQFVARALRAVLDGGDHLLFLLCLLIPVRRARTAATLFGAMIAGQAATMLVTVLWPAPIATWLPALAMTAASVVAIAALHNIVVIARLKPPAFAGLPPRASVDKSRDDERSRWTWLLAIAFGLFNGFTFGQTIADALQFAGAHRAIALVTFLAVVIAGQLWLAALMWATRAWLHGLRLHERVATIVASVLIAHSAVERVVERGHAVALAGSFGAERALVFLTVGWACVMLLVGVSEFLRQRTIHGDRDRATTVMQA